jgi:hypothetical protein
MLLLTGSILGILSPLICFLIHVFIYRLIPGCAKFQRQKLTVIVILLAATSLTFTTWLITNSASESLHSGIVSLLFGYSYFHWFNMSETARRIRILVQYVALGLTPENHQQGYAAHTIVENRIQRLLETNTIQKNPEGKYVLKNGPLLWATRVILFWRSLFYRS